MTRIGTDFDRPPPSWVTMLLEVAFVLLLAAISAAVVALL